MQLTWQHLHASVIQLYEQSLEAGASDAALAQGVLAGLRGEALDEALAPHVGAVRQLSWILLGRLPEVDPAASVAAKVAISSAAAGLGSLQQAIELAWACEEAEQETAAGWPAADRADHFYNRAVAFGARGDLLSAVADASAAIAANPRDVQARMNRGTWLMQLEDVEGAMADWQAAVQAEPDYALGWLKLGAVKLQFGHAAGREDIRRALDCAPADWPHRQQALDWLAE
ncbi:MAG: hypothetical protein H6740_25990 [Alphaproteobacteria bacterium]|nr:hypothetical protein [Alphaproteobacteria bacterium]